MRKTIGNIEYDTTSAKYLGGYQIRSGWCEAREVNAYLYRMPSGEYFEGIFGGEQTEFASGELKPLTASEARAWLSKHVSAARASEEFGAEAPQPEGISLTLTIPPAAAAAITAALMSALPALDIAPLRRALGELVGQGVKHGNG